MDEAKLKEILEAVRAGGLSVEQGFKSLKHLPSESLEFACIDHHRRIRTGMPEVVFGENKTAEQIAGIMKSLMRDSAVALATRVAADKAKAVCENLAGLIYYQESRMLVANEEKVAVNPEARGTVLVISAGTSDMPVAEEAFITARCLGNPVEKLYDVGVAGIHRLVSQMKLIEAATVLVVVAGMEGALPSVIGGLTGKPIIAVPTSVGYGTAFGGIAALLGMLNSCAPGVAVVNIDNGFGAGCMASAINRA
ncbi:MAG: nickel pincer cofactor biosynthesis protein LarB [Proteobacteria bacterium]|nr:nickel pincer cofactor biosynthesis protein LarB [Pseudomonadota bacterium]MBU1708983.1 nickel pincer cofactor biosynthesis protein LarB [Pseudomonadota bacterium]